MSHSFYMYKISKALVEDIKHLSYEELATRFKNEIDDDLFFMENLPSKRIFDFGNLYWDDTSERIYAKGIPLFEQEKTMKRLDEYTPYIVGKEGLLEAINIYQIKVINTFNKMLTNDDRTDKQKLNQFIDYHTDLLNQWNKGRVFNLNEKEEKLTSSLSFEYAIFDLIRLLKSIDFEKDTIIFYGR